MTRKPFDCVEMKRQAAEKIYDHIKNMTIEEELRFWNKGFSDALSDFEDLAALRQAKTEEATASTYSLEQVNTMLGMSTVSN